MNSARRDAVARFSDMKKILVIEDDSQTRENLATILEMEGFDAIAAENGRIGVEMAKRELPDLILCDVSMPEMDGFCVLQTLRSDSLTHSIPLIFLTAKGDRKDFRAGMNLGADDYLSKPATVSELLNAVEARLRRRDQRNQAPSKPIEFKPDFSSSVPLERLGLTPREAEVLLWAAQGKGNGDIAIILGAAEATVKKHMQRVFEKLGVESRGAATLRALEVLNSPASHS